MSEFVGIIPAAGKATRLPGLQGSKEAIPVCALGIANPTHDQARPVCRHLMDAMLSAGIRRQVMVLGEGKSDIPKALANADDRAADCAYVVITDSPGVPWTIDATRSWTRGFNVAFGFPDILTTRPALFIRLCDKLIVVSLTRGGLVTQITPKPPNVGAAQVWIAAVWRPSFSEYLHEHLARTDGTIGRGRELYIGDIINRSIGELHVGAIEFPLGRFLDIGTPSNLQLVRPS
jgi:glucose-1-phosphate thymidylyltransferase